VSSHQARRDRDGAQLASYRRECISAADTRTYIEDVAIWEIFLKSDTNAAKFNFLHVVQLMTKKTT
jgi:hypothetical protein